MALRWLLQHLPLPNEALYPLRTLAFALLLYGVTTLAHGSGFLAVFLAGILVGDTRAPYKREIERFASATGSLGEIVAFTVLGLSIPISEVFGHGRAWTGHRAGGAADPRRPPALRRAAARADPAAARASARSCSGRASRAPSRSCSAPTSWPRGCPAPSRIYAVVFVVVLVSVVVQGGLVPTFARLWQRADAGGRARAVGAGHALPRRARGAAPVRGGPRLGGRRRDDRATSRWRRTCGSAWSAAAAGWCR